MNLELKLGPIYDFLQKSLLGVLALIGVGALKFFGSMMHQDQFMKAVSMLVVSIMAFGLMVKEYKHQKDPHNVEEWDINYMNEEEDR